VHAHLDLLLAICGSLPTLPAVPLALTNRPTMQVVKKHGTTFEYKGNEMKRAARNLLSHVLCYPYGYLQWACSLRITQLIPLTSLGQIHNNEPLLTAITDPTRVPRLGQSEFGPVTGTP
jgi:hypothetical protein